MIFKLKRANTISRFAIFPSAPSWEDLSRRISHLFDIPVGDILVIYIRNKTPTALSDNEELQNFYRKNQTDEEIKFVVQDKENMDGLPSITSTWSAGSNLSDLSNDGKKSPISMVIGSIVGSGKLSLGCFDLSSPNPLLVEIKPGVTVSKLKRLIKKEMGYGCPHNTLNLFKVSPSIPSSELELRLLHVQSPMDIKGCTLLDPLDELWEHFSSPPRKHVHIIVECPSTGTHKRLADDLGSIETPPSKRRRVVCSPPPPEDATGRDGTVQALFERLEQNRFIQVRGTPGSGKTTLAQLLARHIHEEDPRTRIIWLSGWPEDEVNGSGGYRQYLCENGWEEGVKTVFIFDEAQLSYWDHRLWRDFFRDMDRYPNRRAITLESFGSANHICIGGTPFKLTDAQRVTLAAIDHLDGIPPVGLLFTRKEVDDFISVFISEPDNYFHPSFFDALFKITKGHVGAVKVFVQTIMAQASYRKLKQVPLGLYSWDMFLHFVGPRVLLAKLKDSSVFGKGLPDDENIQDHDTTAEIFFAVLRDGYVTSKSITKPGERKKLLDCFQKGYLHSDKIGDGDDVAYFFPSPLHRWFAEWKLCDTLPKVPFKTGNILNFVINVIKKFSPTKLGTEGRIASGGIQRTPEAQYQVEFYRCSNSFSKGSIITFPEYGTADGRVDFFIPVKEWGIELLRDGDRLAQHSGRFSKGGSYATNLECSDYIILDFRKTRPRKSHPKLPKLYHVVLSDDFLDVLILNNKLSQVPGGKIRLLASS